jgi:hypothetical protein
MVRFDKGLRGSALKPYPPGYRAPPTDDINTEEPTLQFGGIKDGGVWLTDQTLPSVIELSVRLDSIWVNSIPPVLVQWGDDALIKLYPPKDALSCVQVIYTGTGCYQNQSGEAEIVFIGNHLSDYTLELPAPYLYQQDFAHQLPGHTIHWMPQSHQLPLWAYGGRTVEDDVQPFVFTVGSMRQESSVTPSSLLYWREQGIVPPAGGHINGQEVIFQDRIPQDQTYSFQESIEAGRAAIRLKIGIDEQGEDVSISYHSFRFSKNRLSFQKGARQ